MNSPGMWKKMEKFDCVERNFMKYSTNIQSSTNKCEKKNFLEMIRTFFFCIFQQLFLYKSLDYV